MRVSEEGENISGEQREAAGRAEAGSMSGEMMARSTRLATRLKGRGREREKEKWREKMRRVEKEKNMGTEEQIKRGKKMGKRDDGGKKRNK